MDHCVDLSALALPIETGRLVLRPWREEDVDQLASSVGRSLEHLRPWMAWAASEPLSREARLAFIRACVDDVRRGVDLVLGVVTREGVVAGGCGLHQRIGPGGLEIGYWIDVDHVRKGLATEAATGLTGAAFTLAGVDRVEIHHDRANAASAGVARRAGFRFVEERQDQVLAPGECGLEWVWRIERADGQTIRRAP